MTVDAIGVVRESLDNLVGETMPDQTAWEFIELAAEVFLPEGTRVSWDGMLAAMVEPLGDEWIAVRLRVSTVADVKSIVIANAVTSPCDPEDTR
jgi:hypothetical protein